MVGETLKAMAKNIHKGAGQGYLMYHYFRRIIIIIALRRSQIVDDSAE